MQNSSGRHIGRDSAEFIKNDADGANQAYFNTVLPSRVAIFPRGNEFH